MTELFSADVYLTRMTRAAALAEGRGIAALVFGTGTDFEYLLGSKISSHERLTALVLRPGHKPLLVVPAVERSDVPDLDVDMHFWRDGQNPHQIVADLIPANATVGFGGSLTADHLLPILELTGARPVLATESLKEQFMRKDTEEIAQLRLAGAAIDRVHAAVPDLLAPGRTEEEVAHELRTLILKEHTSVDFIIVGSGPNGANPHHDYSDRVIHNGDVVVVDIGGTLPSGYHSDCTRTYVMGENEKAQMLYDVLRTAQETAVRAVKPGVKAKDIDAITREIIIANGYEDLIMHRTGHGIGLSLHEEPFIMEGNDLVLEEGMTFSVEPGLYLEGEIGMRLEDIVTVTADGVETLNNADRSLR